MTDTDPASADSAPSPTWAVITPTYKRPELLQKALQSIFDQSVAPSQVIVIIDEPENREAYQFLNDYGSKLEYLFSGGGKGPGGARNLGLEKVESEYVFFLDDDDEWLPEKCEKQLHFLKNNTESIGVFCDYLMQNESGKPLEKKLCRGNIKNHVKSHSYAGSPSFMGYRWTEKTKSLRFDESLPNHEDIEFFLRLFEYGKFGVVEESLVTYRVHGGDRVSANSEKSLRSMEMILEKHREQLSPGEQAWYQAKVHYYRALNSRSAWKIRYESLLSRFHQSRSDIDPDTKESFRKFSRKNIRKHLKNLG